MFLPSSPLATHRGGLFSALCTHTHRREVRDLKCSEAPLHFYLVGLFFPTIWIYLGQVEIVIHWVGAAREEERIRTEIPDAPAEII